MTIEFRCAQCNQLLRVPDASAGKNARCPKCQLLMQIPAPGGAAPAMNIPPPPPPNFVPPPPPPPPGFAPAPSQPANPFDFGGGGSSIGSRSAGGKKPAFDFLGGPAPTNQPASAPPPPPGQSPSGPFNLNAGGPVNPYASPASVHDYPQPSGGKSGGRTGLPWEKPRGKSVQGFMDTAKLVALEPGRAFSMMKQRGDMGECMLYSGIGLAIGVLGTEFWGILYYFVRLSSIGVPSEILTAAMTALMISSAGRLFIGVPLAATLGNLIGAGILHVCLMICGGSRNPYDTSFRIVCYCQASIAWLALIPCGGVIALFWNIALHIIGIHKAHEVPMGRAVMTVLLPMIVCGLLCGLLFFLFFAFALEALSNMR